MTNANKRGKRRDALLTASLATALGMASSAALADASLYANDFETRTSAAPVPALGVWQTAQPYPTSSGIIACCPDEGADYTSLATFFNGNAGASVGRPSIDGWFVPYINNLYKLQPRYQYPFSGSLTENPALTWSYSTETARHGQILNSIHNEFTNGQVRVQFDMKAAVKWAAKGCRVRVFPVYRKFMDILAWEGSRDNNNANVTPGGIAIRGAANGSTTTLDRSFPFWFNSNTSTGTQMGNNDSGKFTDDGSNGKTNYWFRFVVTYDLDNNTFGGEVYRFSKAKGHPAFAT